MLLRRASEERFMHITTTYQPTPDEVLRGTKAATRGFRTRVWIYAIVCLVIGTAGLAVVASFGRLTFGMCLACGACITLGIVYICLLTIGYKRAVAKLSSRVCRPWRTTITEEVYIEESELEKTEVRWPAIVKIEDTAEFFLFYRAKNMAAIVPKRALDPAQVGELSAFVAAYTSGQKPPVHSGRHPVPAAAGGADTQLTARAQDSQLGQAEHGDERPTRSAE
jgi:hypothetical protein